VLHGGLQYTSKGKFHIAHKPNQYTNNMLNNFHSVKKKKRNLPCFAFQTRQK
jgi:hypothetical protein